MQHRLLLKTNKFYWGDKLIGRTFLCRNELSEFDSMTTEIIIKSSIVFPPVPLLYPSCTPTVPLLYQNKNEEEEEEEEGKQ